MIFMGFINVHYVCSFSLLLNFFNFDLFISYILIGSYVLSFVICSDFARYLMISLDIRRQLARHTGQLGN